MIDNYKVGNYITLLRKEKGLTGEKLAEELGISPQAVSKWENGKCLPETSLLPALAKSLGTSIDALLMPRELVILNACYTDGVKFVEVTQTIINYISGNALNIIVNQQFLGITIDSPRIKVLTIKYQTPKGTFYEYALEGAAMVINLDTIKYSEDSAFAIIGAYYGNLADYRSVMQKIQHYDYFKWKDIHVNQESFPSTASADDMEYLLLIYINKKGIFTISCQENETISYTQDRDSLVIKDNSFRILPDITTLEWEKGMDCTWAGATYAALRFLGEDYTYEQLMGMSGACYRVAFTEVWDWSAVDALVAFDYSGILFPAIGYEQIWADRVEKEERNSERLRIIEDINHSKPVLAINLRIAPEWGVITGYRDEGKTLLCRTYFDQEFLNDNKDYLESDFWPFLILHFGEKREKPSETDILTASLKTLIASFHAPCIRGYYQGKQAYVKWIEGLRNEALWDSSNKSADIERRVGVNDAMLLNLIDARRCASLYLKDCIHLLSDQKRELLTQIISKYEYIYHRLKDFRDKLKESNHCELQYNMITTKSDSSYSFRNEEAKLLTELLAIEEDIANNTQMILDGDLNL